MTAQNRDLFEQRLARIRDTHAAGPAQAAPSPSPLPASQGARRSGVILIAALLIAGAAAAPVALRHFGPGAAPDAGDAVAAAAAPSPEGLMARLGAMILGPAEPVPTPTLPEEFLPAPPEGWVRVTQAEARQPDALAGLGAAWAALSADGRAPLDRHPAYPRLLPFLEQNSGPVPDVAARTRGQAFYLGPEGAYLAVSLRFRAGNAAFGPPGDKVAWGQTLRREAKKDAGGDELVESVALGGLSVVNRTRPVGKSLIARPIGKDMETPNGLKLTAALTHRAEVGIVGVAPPSAAAAVLSGFDAPALGRLLD